MIPDGRMVLALIGRTPNKDYCIYQLLKKSLQDMLAEEDIYSFDLPLYHPNTSELYAIIEYEASFHIDRLETFHINWDMRDEDEIIKSGESSGKFIVKIVRAAMESLLASHFENTCMDKIFERYVMQATEQLSRTKIDGFNIVVSLTRKYNN
ncbi:hypothetical protein POM88_023312 [Heracleum sosnowskyi]|uniref:SAM dependent carboxyl methyltransferase n=1 Tax=Heracleum sosnowskyi TaxID=360622 RepID=A0AAD8MUT1_9APIA|nr:hypothetical protein POM88_023312 [Heracleum sosnowskyi]